jgi:hypothetical protein
MGTMTLIPLFIKLRLKEDMAETARAFEVQG